MKSTPSTVISMRLPAESGKRLKRMANRHGWTPSDASARLVEEGLRRSEYGFIDFRDSPAGWQACLQGSTLAVWEVMMLVNISNDVGHVKGRGLVFCSLLAHVLRQRRRTRSFRENNNLAASITHVQPYGSARFLHQRGGLAHQTSLRSRSIMMFYETPPPWGGGGGLFS